MTAHTFLLFFSPQCFPYVHASEKTKSLKRIDNKCTDKHFYLYNNLYKCIICLCICYYFAQEISGDPPDQWAPGHWVTNSVMVSP